jgi:rubrerythrin
MNVFDLAMEKELDVKAYYEKLAEESPLPGLKRVFTLLAGDEQKHFDSIKAMKDGAGPGHLADSTALEAAREILGEMNGDKSIGDQLKNSLESYRLALKVEADSVRFYEGILDKETDNRLKKVLEKILGEEKKHYTIVENLYDFALKPGYFLAWGEFSNLRDL